MVQWTSLYMRTHETVFFAANNRSGWRATGLHPQYSGMTLDKGGQADESVSVNKTSNHVSTEVDLGTSLLGNPLRDVPEL
jgi:hypothetical protein